MEKKGTSVYGGRKEVAAQMVSVGDSAELSTLYRVYVFYECIMVNLLGFITLAFQCQLQKLEVWFRFTYPGVSQLLAARGSEL